MTSCRAFPAFEVEARHCEYSPPLSKVPLLRSPDRESITDILGGSLRSQSERRPVRQDVRDRSRAYCFDKPAQRHRITTLFPDLRAGRRGGDDRLSGSLGRLPLHDAMRNDRSTQLGDRSLGQSNQIQWSFGIRTASQCCRFLMASLGWVAPASEPGFTDSHFNRSFQFGGGL